MGMEDHEVVYTLADINEAFSMGLESAVVILEKSIGLSIQGRRQMIDLLKKRIQKDKIEAAIGRGSHLQLLQ